MIKVALALLLIAGSAAAQPGAPAFVPEQEHVTLWEGGLVVHWGMVGRTYADSDLPHVEWTHDGTTRVALAELVGVVAPGSSRSSGSDVPVDTYVYAASLPVAPGESVSYRVGSEGTMMTEQRSVSRPAKDALHFAAWGDIGVDTTGPDGSCTAAVDTEPPGLRSDCPAHAIRDQIVAARPDLLVIPGDLAYSNSRVGWDSFMRFMEPIQGSTPTMPVAGNHEYHASLGYAQFLSEYVLPGDEHRYTFQAGPVTFVGINSDRICGDHQTPSGPPQDPCRGEHLSDDYTEWVREALQAAAEDETPWTVFFMHHPMFSYGRHGDHEGLQRLYLDWVEEYRVDVVLTSHDHLYSRSHPMIQGTPIQNGSDYAKGDGVVHLVTGGGGRGLYEQRGSPPAWLAVGESVHHFVEFNVNQTHMQVVATRIDGSRLDAFTIAPGPLEPETPSRSAPGAMAPLGLLAVVGLAGWRSRR